MQGDDPLWTSEQDNPSGKDFMSSRKKNRQLITRMSEEDMERFRKMVERSGLTQQEFVSRCIFGKKIVDASASGLAELEEAAVELKRQGTNLNQIAHAVNAARLEENGSRLCSTYEELLVTQQEWRRTWRLLRSSIQALRLRLH